MSCGHDGCTCGSGDGHAHGHDHSASHDECCGGHHRQNAGEEKVGPPARRPE